MKLNRPTNPMPKPSKWQIFMVARCIAFLFVSAVVTVHAEQWTPSNQFLDVIRKIESADGRLTIGDHGNSLGAYQLSEAAWLDVSGWRRARGHATFDYETGVWTESVSRSYAADYCKILHELLSKRMKRTATPAEVYAAYNMGVAAFARCQFSLDKVNSITASRCRYITAVLTESLLVAAN